jgi:hypothetical protein
LFGKVKKFGHTEVHIRTSYLWPISWSPWKWLCTWCKNVEWNMSSCLYYCVCQLLAFNDLFTLYNCWI